MFFIILHLDSLVCRIKCGCYNLRVCCFFTVELFTGSCVSCGSLLWRIYRATLLCEAAPFAWRYHASCWFVIFVNSVLGWTVFASGARWVMWIFRSPERWEKNLADFKKFWHDGRVFLKSPPANFQLLTWTAVLANHQSGSKAFPVHLVKS